MVTWWAAPQGTARGRSVGGKCRLHAQSEQPCAAQCPPSGCPGWRPRLCSTGRSLCLHICKRDAAETGQALRSGAKQTANVQAQAAQQAGHVMSRQAVRRRQWHRSPGSGGVGCPLLQSLTSAYESTWCTSSRCCGEPPPPTHVYAFLDKQLQDACQCWQAASAAGAGGVTALRPSACSPIVAGPHQQRLPIGQGVVEQVSACAHGASALFGSLIDGHHQLQVSLLCRQQARAECGGWVNLQDLCALTYTLLVTLPFTAGDSKEQSVGIKLTYKICEIDVNCASSHSLSNREGYSFFLQSLPKAPVQDVQSTPTRQRPEAHKCASTLR